MDLLCCQLDYQGSTHILLGFIRFGSGRQWGMSRILIWNNTEGRGGKREKRERGYCSVCMIYPSCHSILDRQAILSVPNTFYSKNMPQNVNAHECNL